MDNPISSRFVDPKISVFFTIIAPDYWAGRSGPKRRLGDVSGRR
jgi:hypothetical protein